MSSVIIDALAKAPRAWENPCRSQHALSGGAIALAAIAGVASSAAHAQTKQEFNWCIGEGNPTPAQKITGCTAVIQAGKLKGKRLAFTFSNRGVAYYERGEYDRAIQDFEQAIALNPKYALAFNNRCAAYHDKG